MKNKVSMNTPNTVFDGKCLTECRFDAASIQSDIKYWLFMMVNDANRPKVQVEYKRETKCFFPEEVSSPVLTKITKIKEITETYPGKPVTTAVVTMLADFSDFH